MCPASGWVRCASQETVAYNQSNALEDRKGPFLAVYATRFDNSEGRDNS